MRIRTITAWLVLLAGLTLALPAGVPIALAGEEAVADALREVQKAGVEVIYPDKTPFRESVREMHESYRGTPVYSLLTEIAGIQ